MSRKGTKLLYSRTVKDPILRAVLADINKSAQTPDPGFRTRQQWAKVWGIASNHADRYIQRAVKIGKLVRKDFRIVTKTRLRMMVHFGPPSKKGR
jgi:hypothetical protein